MIKSIENLKSPPGVVNSSAEQSENALKAFTVIIFIGRIIIVGVTAVSSF